MIYNYRYSDIIALKRDLPILKTIRTLGKYPNNIDESFRRCEDKITVGRVLIARFF